MAMRVKRSKKVEDQIDTISCFMIIVLPFSLVGLAIVRPNELTYAAAILAAATLIGLFSSKKAKKVIAIGVGVGTLAGIIAMFLIPIPKIAWLMVILPGVLFSQALYRLGK